MGRAGRAVLRSSTNSSHLLTTDKGTKILLDCGLYQGNDPDFDDFNHEWVFNPADIDVMVLSHSHIDHAGRIPKLCKDGFEGDVVCTSATRDLAAIMLLDSGFIQEKDNEWMNKRRARKDLPPVPPLYIRCQMHNVLWNSLLVLVMDGGFV